MFILGSEYKEQALFPVDLLPLRIRRYFFGIDTGTVCEIRLRCGLPLCVVTNKGKKYVSANNRLTEQPHGAVTITRRDIDEAVELLTESSLYSYHNELKKGFITAHGGHRVGVCGCVNAEEDFISDISGLNYRFAREIKDCAKPVFERVFCNGDIKSTLIVSKPGCGKTTFLRDLIRLTSDSGINVGVVDERGEIASVYDGITRFDLGVNCDVMSLCTKNAGINMMVRTMSPSVIAVDELGVSEDYEAICNCAKSGVKIFATAHCGDWKRDINPQILSHFKCVITLSSKNGPGTIEECVYV